MSVEVSCLEHIRPDALPEGPEALIAIDTHARVTGINAAACRMLGADTESLAGRPVLDAVASPALCTLILGVLIGGGPCEGYVALCGEPEQRVQARAEPLTNEDGNAAGGVLILSVG